MADWTRRLAANAEAIRIHATRHIVAPDQELLPTAVHPTPLANAMEALGRLAMATASRFTNRLDPWQVLAVVTGGRLLRPTFPD